jgi:hypothetical protein
MSIVLLGSTSGSCTLQEQAVAGTSVLTLPVGTGTVVANNVNSAIVSGTAVASTSGTSIDFTSIPSWVKRITVMFDGVSNTGVDQDYLIQIGTSGGNQTSGYLSQAWGNGSTIQSSTAGFRLSNADNAGGASSGVIMLALLNSATGVWCSSGVIGYSTVLATSSGSKTLSGTLDRIRITTVAGTATFDAGSINILYE